jgi:hypothetical protein
MHLKHGDKIQINRTVFALLTPLETTKVFVSYGSPDADFAGALASTLGTKGFDVFFFPDSSQDHIGEQIFSVIRREISNRHVVLLVCSKESLSRKGVLAELTHVLAKEEREGGTGFLIPIALDDSFLHWSSEDAALGDAIRERIVADFRNNRSGASMDAAFERLAITLRRIGQRR